MTNVLLSYESGGLGNSSLMHCFKDNLHRMLSSRVSHSDGKSFAVICKRIQTELKVAAGKKQFVRKLPTWMEKLHKLSLR